EVTEGLGHRVHRQRALVVDDAQVVERDDAWQLRHVARERAHVVVAARDLHVDRKLGVEVGHPLLRGWLEQLELQPSAEPGLVYVSSASISVLLGSCVRSPPKDCSISFNCWTYSSRLTARAFFEAFSSLSFASLACALSSASN